MRWLNRALSLSIPLFLAEASAQFSINFSFADPLTPTQETAFTDAVDTWEGLIQGYQPGIDGISGVDVTVASAGGTSGPTKVLVRSGYILSDEARVIADPTTIAALDQATLELFFTREIGHALGFGTLWALNNLYLTDSGEYTGSAGLAAYQAEFDPSATFVPVELYAGESNVHWDEIDLAAGLTGITNSSGQDFGDDLMTAWLGPNAADTYLSDTTIASLEDLGYELFAGGAAVPEPHSALLALLSGGLLLRRKRSQR